MNLTVILLIHPGTMLLAGLLTLIALTWFFLPKKGGLALLSNVKMNNQRVHLEDALKFMFDCEYKGTDFDTNSIAGNLGITADKASRLISRLLEMGLIDINNQAIELTDTGRSYALRIIRVHRIWERYLADETSVDQADWHNEACEIEHRVTVEDTEKLAAKIGHPVYDPHGDPIPTSDGDLPEMKGKPLNTAQEGETGIIIHIEDEPRSVYEQLVVLGLYPGMKVYVTDESENKITFVANGDEIVLTRHFAGYITIENLAGEIEQSPKQELLSSLKIGEEAEISGISPNCRGQQRRRLMDLGMIPGSKVSAIMKSASGDPVGYRVLGTTIGIRKQQADLVFINRNIEK